MSSSRRQYPFHLIEPKWQKLWDEQETFRAWNPGESIPEQHPFARRHTSLPPKFYILDMFPYPSGAGLHVGHPEGYTATDILARYKRAAGFNVLHPFGWDAFGLPAEQYAIKTGQHPRATTEANIANFKRQIKALGFSYDWSREVDTTDPDYFKWTQWIFLKLYHSWFNPQTNKAAPIETLAYPPELETEEERRAFRDGKRLAYVAEMPVWWCEELGTVLANEEVIDGMSEVGGFPVVRKPMRQWMLRITAYAERLLNDLDTIDWSDSLKEMQRNWIGRSEGAEADFEIADCGLRIADCDKRIRVFTTRPDTLFGATYMVLAPEHRLVDKIVPSEWPPNTPDLWKGTSPEAIRNPQSAIRNYMAFAASKSDLERTELAKEKTGVFTGAYAINPVNGERIPIWIADYVLATYGTGAIMAVPGHDQRDLEFARKYQLPIRQVVQAPEGIESIGYVGDGISVNSGSLNGLPTPEAKGKITAWLESKGLGTKTINYKLRDWLFSRQRYWGEPFPIVWRSGSDGRLYHEALPESALPLLPPALTDYKPTSSGEPPLARAKEWVNLPDGSVRETNTMPQWAGSCWYYLRYLDARNSRMFCSTLAERYWMGAGTSPSSPSALKREDWREQFLRLYDCALENKSNEKQVVQYGKVDEITAQFLQQKTGLQLHGFVHQVDNYAVRHIMQSHGDPDTEGQRGLLALTLNDLLLIPDIVERPDEVRFVGKNKHGLDVILYTKTINGCLCYLEEVRTKHSVLAANTFYKKPATGSDAAETAACSCTSETHRRTDQTLNPASAIRNPELPTPGVDLYVGGTEHAVLHLLYARFWHKVLFDLGCVSTPEPFFKLVNQGLILGEDGQKMSKSRGNVINPDDILAEYGADAFRLYEMFMGPLEMVKPWSTKGVEGVYRFLGRVWRLFVDEKSETEFEQSLTVAAENGPAELEKVRLSAAIQEVKATPAQLKALHACIKKVTEDLDGLRFNTAISALMIFVNEAMTWPAKPRGVLMEFLKLLQPFAPHLAEELHARLSGPSAAFLSAAPEQAGQTQPAATLAYLPWPKFDPALLLEETLEIPIQVNGKLRDVIRVPAGATAAQVEAAALGSEKIQPFLQGKTVKKVIVVPKKVVNIAVA